MYRVTRVVGGLVEVEVVRAPGLTPGMLLRFTSDAVAGMDVVEEREFAATARGRVAAM